MEVSTRSGNLNKPTVKLFSGESLAETVACAENTKGKKKKKVFFSQKLVFLLARPRVHCACPKITDPFGLSVSRKKGQSVSQSKSIVFPSKTRNFASLGIKTFKSLKTLQVDSQKDSIGCVVLRNFTGEEFKNCRKSDSSTQNYDRTLCKTMT